MPENIGDYTKMKVHLNFYVNDNKNDLGEVNATFIFKNITELKKKISKFERDVRRDWSDVEHRGQIWISQSEPVTINGKEFEY
jgi:hypothetical protein